MHDALKNPSVYAHTFGGVLGFLAVAIVFLNMSTISKLEPYKLIVLALLSSIAISVHGISHIGLEAVYKYNPWKLIVGRKNES